MRAPWLASRRQIAAPMPLVPPVTRAIRSRTSPPAGLPDSGSCSVDVMGVISVRRGLTCRAGRTGLGVPGLAYRAWRTGGGVRGLAYRAWRTAVWRAEGDVRGLA